MSVFTMNQKLFHPQLSKLIILFFLEKKYLFISLLRQTERAAGRGRRRVLSKLCTEHRARHGAQSHDSEVTT